ncbi:MAG: rRNA maturation RNase YbeY [Chthoniobacterales bacterium]|nr:rRNA maturation RNase YbeY [Chthoniobacterales bacterium]
MAAQPVLVWSNRQRTVPARQLRLARVSRALQNALPLILDAARKGSVLARLPEVWFVIVSDARITDLHDRFLGDPSPTDVITFQHGEIALSAETARREARARGLGVPEEIARYAVHGLLHLAGWDDGTPSSASSMRATQEKILRRACRGVC